MLNKRGKNWWLDIWIGHGKARKRVRRSLKTDERALAIDRARDIERELREGADKRGVSLREFSAKYLEWARATKPASYRAEKYRLEIMLPWFDSAGVSSLEEITPYHIEQLRAWLRQRILKRQGKAYDAGRSRSTINRYLQLLRGMFYRAIDWEIYKGPNPLRRVKFYREGEKIRPLAAAEIQKAIDAARDLGAARDATPIQRVLYDVCRLILNTGLRRSEALNLRWTDIADEELMIRGKGGKMRTVPLNESARGILAAQRRLGPYIFDVPNRNSLSVLRRSVDRISAKVGVRFGLHLLRHAFATRLLASGADIITVSAILGHGAAMTTLLYTHSSPERMRRAVDSLPA
jgi:integrase